MCLVGKCWSDLSFEREDRTIEHVANVMVRFDQVSGKLRNPLACCRRRVSYLYIYDLDSTYQYIFAKSYTQSIPRTVIYRHLPRVHKDWPRRPRSKFFQDAFLVQDPTIISLEEVGTSHKIATFQPKARHCHISLVQWQIDFSNSKRELRCRIDCLHLR